MNVTGNLRKITKFGIRITAVATLALAGCGGGGGGGSAGVTLSSISISPATASVAAGVTKQFSVTGNYSDGTTLPITTASWSSSSITVSTVASTGLARGEAPGNSNIVASYGGQTATASLTVTSAVPISISIAGLTSGITNYAKRTVTQLSASVRYSDGTTRASTSAVWSSSDTNVFTVANGLLTGVGPGTATINLTADGFSITKGITIVNPVATPLLVTCNPATPMTLSAATWSANYAIDPTNATEWVTVDNTTCGAYTYIVLVAPSASRRILEATNSGGAFRPAVTTSSSLTPQLSTGAAVDIGYEAALSSFFYTQIYQITAQ